MKKIFISRKIPKEGIELLSKNYHVDIWQDSLPPSKDVLIERTKDCHGLISLLTDPVDAELFEACPNLEVVSNYAAGFNNIDIKAARRRKIRVGNTPDVLTAATADIALTLLMATSRHLVAARQNALKGNWKTWEPLGFLGIDLRRKTLGILGMGRIGTEFARIMHEAYGMKIIYCGATPKIYQEKRFNCSKVDFDTLAKESDVISIHCPLTKATENLVDAHFLSNMKENAILINTARGEIVQHDALADVLESGKLFAAGLDVTSPEPLPPDHRLFELKNCIILPHIGSATFEARKAMSLLCAKNIIGAMEEKPMPSEIEVI